MSWLENNVKRILSHKGPTIIQANSRWGTSHIIQSLADSTRPLVWLELDEHDREDEVSIGNKLAEAIERIANRGLLNYGLSYTYGLSFLHRYGTSIGPFTYALSNAQIHPKFAAHLIELGQGENKTILSCDETHASQLTYQSDQLLLTDKDLSLNLADAKTLAKGVPETLVKHLLETSQGAYEVFLSLLHKECDFPLPIRPTPLGYWLAPGFEMGASLEELLQALVQKQRWMEALKLSAAKFPHKVPEVLKKSGNYFLSRGLYKQLWPILMSLDSEAQNNEQVLFLLLETACQLQCQEEIREKIKTYLTTHDAANLRAYYAVTFESYETSLSMLKNAVDQEKTPYTLFQYGLSLGRQDPHLGESLLRDAIKLADQQDDNYALVRNAWGLAARLITLGHYKEATFWSEWALETYQKHGLQNNRRWLIIANEWTFARILIGETAGLEALLIEASTHLAQASPNLRQLIHSTLGDYHLSQGLPEKALDYYQKNLSASNRASMGRHSCFVVRALTELGHISEAVRIAEKAAHLAKDQGFANLALGMALSFQSPELAIPHLEQAITYFTKPLQALFLGQAGIYLAKIYVEKNMLSAATKVLDATKLGRQELADSGLRYLAGPHLIFEPIYTLNQEKRMTLRLSFLGKHKATLDGQILKLSKRQREVLAILALYPEGLSGDELALYLIDERSDKSSIKSLLSRLRKLVPINSQPYRLAVNVEADFLKVQKLLLENKVVEATSLYKGPLLRESEAPRLKLERDFIEGNLRNSVLNSEKAESLFHLCSVMQDDLELWEKLMTILPVTDPRYPLAAAKTDQTKLLWRH